MFIGCSCSLRGRLGIIVFDCCWKDLSSSTAHWQQGLLYDRSLMSGWSEKMLSALTLCVCVHASMKDQVNLNKELQRTVSSVSLFPLHLQMLFWMYRHMERWNYTKQLKRRRGSRWLQRTGICIKVSQRDKKLNFCFASEKTFSDSDCFKEMWQSSTSPHAVDGRERSGKTCEMSLLWS